MDAPLNIDKLDLADLVAESGEAAWKGGYFAYGTNGAERSTVIYFAVPRASGSASTPTPPRRPSSSSRAAARSCSTPATRTSAPAT